MSRRYKVVTTHGLGSFLNKNGDSYCKFGPARLFQPLTCSTLNLGGATKYREHRPATSRIKKWPMTLFTGRVAPPCPTRAVIEEQAERDAQNHAVDAEKLQEVPDHGAVDIFWRRTIHRDTSTPARISDKGSFFRKSYMGPQGADAATVSDESTRVLPHPIWGNMRRGSSPDI
ncbi:hypothetical protein GGX14DRAFT_394384 [Mycena pura]|uniref:Uncharacterized protein n=1 Tax=Mycena pura TaxID=153505 RepID=A0AAD6VIA9_9AGAR|nr:hypothetical protein GGX14DRAFT_394384 [Mycena pura]